MRGFLTTLAGLSVALLPLCEAEGQSRHDLVESVRDWSVFQAGDGDGRVCWVASKPTQSRALRDGKPVEVRRGDIYLMVSFRPADEAEREVSFLAGYPFEQGSKVETEIGGKEWEMFTVGESAWLSSSDKDAEVVEAFKQGADTKITGVSSRGTTTIDTFSLMGFTEAVEQARGLCS